MFSKLFQVQANTALFQLNIYDVPDDIICSIAIYPDGPVFCSQCQRPSELWQQLEMASEFEFGFLFL